MSRSKSIEADILGEDVAAPVVDAAVEALSDDEPTEPLQESKTSPIQAKAAAEEDFVIPFGGMPAVDISKHAASVDAAVQAKKVVKTSGDTTATGMKITAGPGVSDKKVNEPNIQHPRSHDPGYKKPQPIAGESEFSSVTMQKFDNKIMEYRNEQIAYENAQAEADRLKKIMKNTEAWLHACMNEHKKTSYKSSIGTLIVSKTFTVKLPDSLEKKRSAYGWIAEQEGKEKLEAMLSINSKTFNKYYREKQEAAFDEGEVDFSIPGVDEPKFIEKFSVRKK